MTDMNLVVVSEVLGNTSIGFITPVIVGILVVVVIALLMYKGKDQSKTIVAMLPISLLLATIGFQINTIFIILIAMLFVIITILGTEFKQATIEA